MFEEASFSQTCGISGQKVNLSKSKLCISRNISSNAQLAFSRQIGIPLSLDLKSYLGLPLLHTRVTKDTFSYLVTKVRKKLEGWKSKLLSRAKKAVLTQSISSSVPIYAMQTVKVPPRVLHTIDSANRNFLWHADEGKIGLCPIAWKTVCTTKSFGGLGFRNLHHIIYAALAKTGLEDVTDSSTL